MGIFSWSIRMLCLITYSSLLKSLHKWLERSVREPSSPLWIHSKAQSFCKFMGTVCHLKSDFIWMVSGYEMLLLNLMKTDGWKRGKSRAAAFSCLEKHDKLWRAELCCVGCLANSFLPTNFNISCYLKLGDTICTEINRPWKDCKNLQAYLRGSKIKDITDIKKSR